MRRSVKEQSVESTRNYLYEVDRLRAEVAAIAEEYTDPEGCYSAHRREDAMIERFVRDAGYEGDERAMIIVELLDLRRKRRYG
jgi:hypothetical protein